MAEGLGFGMRKLVDKIITTNWNVEPSTKHFSYQELLYILQELHTEEGKAYQEGDNSALRGHYIFRSFVKHLLYRNVANYDSMILLSGDKGLGKSSNAIMLGREWMRLLGRRFDPKIHIAYNNADVMKKIDELPPFSPLVCDESVRFAAGSDWNRRENKELRKRLAQVRTKHLLYILCFPLKVYKLEKNYLESFVNYWIDCVARGVGAIYVKDRNPVSDTWRTKEFKLVGSYTEFTNLSRVEKALQKHPNFWTVIRFPRPPMWLYNRYLGVREKNIYDDDNVFQAISKEDIYNALLILALRDIMMNDTTLTMNRIILHIRNQYDINVSKQMVGIAIEDAKQLISRIREQAIKEV